jgi:hypothetical protein
MNTTTSVIGSGTVSSPYSTPEIVSVSVSKDKVEIVKRAHPLFTYTVCSPNSTPVDRVWKEVWQIFGGELTRLPDVEGAHTPAYHVPEAIEFP